MKLIVASLLLICIACGTASAQSTVITPPVSTPEPTSTPLTDYKPCLTVLAYLAVHHHHEGPVTDSLGNSYISDATVPNTTRPLTFSPSDEETPQDLVDRFCADILDAETLSDIASQLNRR